MIKIKIILITCTSLIFNILFGQPSPQIHSGEIYQGIRKLNELGSVLYIAAHPDDENTRLITCLSKEYNIRTAYLSLTRGDGGQNLIGPELDEFLGVIRTNELVEARKIDGGSQYFTSAVDFGYSKNAEETFKKWDREKLLIEIVKLIRTFKPTAIITRFDHRTSGKTHGHHTASAILALEAFTKASDPNFAPTELAQFKPWVVEGIYYNTSWWAWGSKEKFDQADKSNYYQIDVGHYLAFEGKSATEIAAKSRSMHKSQGFGINSVRGSQIEYLERLDKAKNKSTSNLIDEISLNWNSTGISSTLTSVIDSCLMHFDYLRPELSIPTLQKIEEELSLLPESALRNIKLEETKELIRQCAGIYFSAHTTKQTITTGDSLQVQCEVVNRSRTPITLQFLQFMEDGVEIPVDKLLTNNEVFNLISSYKLSEQSSITSPFWLLKQKVNSHFKIEAKQNVSKPLTDRNLNIIFSYKIFNHTYEYKSPVYYKNDDPVLGEVSQPLDILPQITSVSGDQLILMKPESEANYTITLINHSGDFSGNIEFICPEDIEVLPQKLHVQFESSPQTKIFDIKIKNRTKNQSISEINMMLDQKQLYTHTTIEYPHLDIQNVLTPSKIKVSIASYHADKKRIAYIKGAGDYTLEAIKKLGYDAHEITINQINNDLKKKFDVLIFGIRALNTNKEIINKYNLLEKFMNEGGKLVFQYNTTAELPPGKFSPFDMQISRDRVTEEDSKVIITNPNHPLLSHPNKITESDFELWVQERGLYFPNKIDPKFMTVLSMSDSGENQLTNAIITANVGKGKYVYTGLSFFRQLAAGVPGAYRLFNNIISY